MGYATSGRGGMGRPGVIALVAGIAAVPRHFIGSGGALMVCAVIMQLLVAAALGAPSAARILRRRIAHALPDQVIVIDDMLELGDRA